MSTVVERPVERGPQSTAADTARPRQRPPARRGLWRGPRRPNFLAGAGALVWLVVVALPIYAILAASLRHRADYQDDGPLAPPGPVTFQNFADAIEGGFGTYMLNTAIVTVASVALVLLLAVPAAYAIVRSPHRLVSGAFRLFLLGLAIPAQATIIPVYLIITRLYLYDSLTAVVLPTVAFGLPLAILVLAGTLRDVPRELYEAMSIEGAGAARLLRNLVLPLGRAGITAVAIYTTLQAWNGFLFPLVLTQTPSRRVVTLGLWIFQGLYAVNVPGLFAAVLLSTLPIFALYLFARRGLIAGLTGVGGR